MNITLITISFYLITINPSKNRYHISEKSAKCSEANIKLKLKTKLIQMHWE